MQAVITTQAKSTTAKGIGRSMEDDASYIPAVCMPAPLWCRMCETFIEAGDFTRHRRFEHGSLQCPPVFLGKPAKPPRAELACIRCGKTFASFTYWEQHENVCLSQKLDTNFMNTTPLIVDVN